MQRLFRNADRMAARQAVPEISLQLLVETPENVVLAYQLAGPAIRGVAYLIDFGVRMGAMIALMTVLGSMLAFILPGFSLGLLLLLLFLNEWGYYVLCEYFFQGKSVGKHMLGLRVIQEKGYPITFWSSLLRNLVRAVDAVPLYGPALLSMLGSKSFQRLGDRVARTIVVQERQVRLPREPVILEKIPPLSRDDLGSYVPSDPTLALIDQFLGRRHVLTHQRGHALASILAGVLARRLNYQGDPELVRNYPMAFLARVYVTFIKDQQNGDTDPDRREFSSQTHRTAAGVI